MTHAYELHVDLLAQCFCCRSRQPFNFTSATDQVVCSFCTRHVGSDKSERRDQDHLRLWVEIFSDEQAMHRAYVAATQQGIAERDATIEDLSSRVTELADLVAGQFDETPSDGVRGLLQNDLVKRAERKTELASRQIDWAMAVIWRLSVLHHDDADKPLYCVCGRRAPSCAEAKAIDPVRTAVTDWEKKNERLLLGGKRHGLPDDHPAVTTGRLA
ncbi:hypothetical protein [Cryobacterium psychrophilum]|uniref:Uncharacterized protein n=1 Tax=Cryobacterium psychrophilum TaxID=41988 RepID=A0A4Y8KP31_9MICO|nr:hypothetical protein [Cryobacterium psychrophilum]TDW30242.1 hypothetical protein EDD25_1991 [Cryobacterium psychrophilum]TFD77465.1 hypothetical protein E3T53_11660 [Cryobacterium psychrophilum]